VNALPGGGFDAHGRRVAAAGCVVGKDEFVVADFGYGVAIE
jgi:hypothetical protein